MSNQNFDSYDEKRDEKDEKDRVEVQEKSEKELSKHDEKSMDEKWRNDPVAAITWAAILIWAGVVLLASNIGLLDRILLPAGGDHGLVRMDSWSIILIGAGALLLGSVLLRLLVPAYRRPIGGAIFLALILIGVGLGDLFKWELVGALMLIALGLTLILRRWFR